MDVSTPPVAAGAPPDDAPRTATPPEPSPPAAGFAPVVVAPTYNNATALPDVLRRVRATGLPLIVVNDGSSDDTAALLADHLRDYPDTIVRTHARNRGKAAALRTGFAAAGEAGYSHALTIDTDGQLDPEQIPDLVAAAGRRPHALVVGYRDDRAADYPARSRLGRRLSNLMVRLESGVRVEDSQCGFRVYPLGLVDAVRPKAGRYAFETEIITRAGWAGCPVEQVPVCCRYLPAGQRVSHFRPWLDTFRGLALHARLLGRALLPWPHPKWPGKRSEVGTAEPKTSLRKQIWAWVSPREMWRQLRRDRVGRTELATGLAVGAFIANLPLYPVQTLAAAYVAQRLHLHLLAVVLGSQLSIPLLSPFLIAAAIGVGHLVLRGDWPALSDFNVVNVGFAHLFRNLLLEWLVGGIIVGFACAVVVFVLAVGLFRFVAADSEPPSLEAQ